MVLLISLGSVFIIKLIIIVRKQCVYNIKRVLQIISSNFENFSIKRYSLRYLVQIPQGHIVR